MERENKCLHYWENDGVIFKIAEQIYNPDPPEGRNHHCYLIKEVDKEVEYLNHLNLETREIYPAFIPQIEERQGIFVPSGVEDYESFDELYTENLKHVSEFIDLDTYDLHMGVIFIMTSWIYNAYMNVPYIKILGDFNTGKSRYINAIGLSCYRPFIVNSSSSIAALRRMVHGIRGTMVLDEFDSPLH